MSTTDICKQTSICALDDGHTCFRYILENIDAVLMYPLYYIMNDPKLSRSTKQS